MEVFTQFSSDLDDSTKRQLAHGKSLMELLKQPLGKPLSMAEQVVTLIAANEHVFSDLDASKVKEFQGGLLNEFNENHKDIMTKLTSKKELTPELRESILEAAQDFKKQQFDEEETEETEAEE